MIPSLPSSIEAVPSATREASERAFTAQVLHSFADAGKFHAMWNELVLRSGADIYQTLEWCQQWWHYYGARRALHLLLCFDGDELVGLIPAFVETLWLGPSRIRVAKLIGSDFSLQICNLPVMPNAVDWTVARAVRHFLGDQKCDILVTGPLSGPSAQIHEILAAGQAEHDLVKRAESLGHSTAIRFDLPKDFAAYQDVIGSRQRGNYSRSVKHFSKNHQVVADEVSDAGAVLGELEFFQSLHESQWAAEGKLGHFGDWPMCAEFNRSLVECFGKLGMVRFFRIQADGRTVSSQFCFMFGGTNYWRLPGRECRTEWENLSLGKMGLIKMIETSLAQGVRAVEGGRGHYRLQAAVGREGMAAAHGPVCPERIRGGIARTGLPPDRLNP